MALLIRKRQVGDIFSLEVNKDNTGWKQLPNGTMTPNYSEDDTTVIFFDGMGSSYISSNPIPISDILDVDNGNLPFTADTLRDYLTGNGFFEKAPGLKGALSDIKKLQNAKIKLTFYRVIETGGGQTSGQISFPTGAELDQESLKDFENCILSEIGSDQTPTGEDPEKISGGLADSTLDINGNWTISGAVGSDIAIVFRVIIARIDYDNWNQSDLDNIIDAVYLGDEVVKDNSIYNSIVNQTTSDSPQTCLPTLVTKDLPNAIYKVVFSVRFNHNATNNDYIGGPYLNGNPITEDRGIQIEMKDSSGNWEGTGSDQKHPSGSLLFLQLSGINTLEWKHHSSVAGVNSATWDIKISYETWKSL